MSSDDPTASLPDPLARQAVGLLAKAMLSSRDRDGLWRRFQELVNEETTRLEEAPARELLAEAERRGISLDVVARVAVRSLDPDPASSLVTELRRARSRDDRPSGSRKDS
jgi:hypothetical protein